MLGPGAIVTECDTGPSAAELGRFGCRISGDLALEQLATQLRKMWPSGVFLQPRWIATEG